jgi:hypothetical protein
MTTFREQQSLHKLVRSKQLDLSFGEDGQSLYVHLLELQNSVKRNQLYQWQAPRFCPVKPHRNIASSPLTPVVAIIHQFCKNLEHVKEDLSLALIAHLQDASQWTVLATDAYPHHAHHCLKKILNPNHHLDNI